MTDGSWINLKKHPPRVWDVIIPYGQVQFGTSKVVESSEEFASETCIPVDECYFACKLKKRGYSILQDEFRYFMKPPILICIYMYIYIYTIEKQYLYSYSFIDLLGLIFMTFGWRFFRQKKQVPSCFWSSTPLLLHKNHQDGNSPRRGTDGAGGHWLVWLI